MCVHIHKNMGGVCIYIKNMGHIYINKNMWGCVHIYICTHIYFKPIQLPSVVSIILTETNGWVFFYFKGRKSPLSVGDL